MLLVDIGLWIRKDFPPARNHGSGMSAAPQRLDDTWAVRPSSLPTAMLMQAGNQHSVC